MQIIRPDFFDSEYLYINGKGEYSLKEDAPEKMKIEFEEYMKQVNQNS